eukprot:169746_1
MKNKRQINSMKNEIINQIHNRMDELRNKSENEINNKQRQIESHRNNIKLYEQSLNNAQIIHNKLLNDNTFDQTKRKIEILEVNKNVKHSNCMNNKPNINAMISIQFNKTEINNFIQTIGHINNWMKWTSNQFVDWIITLDSGEYKKYENTLRDSFGKEQVDGSSIPHIGRSDWQGWGITNLKHRVQLQNHIQRLISTNYETPYI